MSIAHYALQVINPLKELFMQDKSSDIPAFSINPDTDLDIIASNVSSLAITTEASDTYDTNVANNFETIATYIQDPINLPRLDPIEHTSKALANIIENSYNTISSDIASQVTSIKASVEDRYVELMKRDKVEELITSADIAITESDYTFIRWDRLSSAMRVNDVIESVCTSINISKPELSLLNLSYALQKIHFQGYQTVSITPETRDRILDQLIPTFTSDRYGITEERVRKFVDIVTDTSKYATFCKTSVALMKDQKSLAINTLFHISQANNFITLIDAVSKVLSNSTEAYSDATLSGIANNAKVLRKSIQVIQYNILVTKNIKYKDKLILSKNIINESVYKEYVSDGNTISDVHNYLKAFHSDSTIPTSGISIRVVTNANTDERLTIASAKLRTQATYIKTKNLISAFESVTHKYILAALDTDEYNHTDSVNLMSVWKSLVKVKTSQLRGEIGKVDDVLYELIIGTFYKNTPIATIYKYFNKGFVDLTTKDEDITDEDILMTECNATIDMLTEFLVNTVVEK